MKVAIDSGPLTGGHAIRGIGVYTKFLIEHLKKIKGLKIDVVDFRKTDLSKYNIAHYPHFHPYFITLPLTKKTKTVVTIHDLIPLIYPKHYPPGIRGKIKFLLQKLLVKNIDGILTVSETSKKDIVRFLGIPLEKVQVVYEAPREIFRPMAKQQSLSVVQEKYDLPKNFILYVGDVNYNKNILGLASACKIAKIPLVMAGKQAKSEDFDRNHPENQPLVRFLEKYGKDPGVIRLGFVPDEDLVVIYNLATIYCQPSFYEGFGLPVLEAFVCGTPAVVAKTQALVEIAEGAALLADPKNTRDIAEKILRLLTNSKLRDQLVEKGRKRAGQFSWNKTAKETTNFYRKLIKQ